MGELENRSNCFGSNTLVALSLLLVFLGPLLAAWWFVESEATKDMDRNNYGNLITPPVDLRVEKNLRALQAIDLETGEWGILYFTNGECAERCQNKIEVLKLIRTLLARDGPRLHLWVLAEQGQHTNNQNFIVNLEAVSKLKEILTKRFPEASFADGAVIIDWRFQVMMFYPELDPDGVKKDVSRLLRGSRLR